MYSRILVPLDGSDLSEHVLSYVITLGLALDCPIKLLRIPENPPVYTGGDFASIPVGYEDYAEEERIAESQKYLDDKADFLREKGLNVSTVVRSGRAADTIVDEAMKNEDALVAMATHSRSGVARWILGSVADVVLRKSTNHLLLVRPPIHDSSIEGMPVNRIIAPVDGSLLAEQTLTHVAGLAKALGATIDLVRVTPSASEYYRQAVIHPTEGPAINFYPPYEEFVAAADSEAKEYLEKTQTELEGKGVFLVESHSVHGHPAGVIADMAKSGPGNMVVIATHGRSGIGRWVLGSVADSVARYAGCPVLIIRAQENG